jgi:LemA protein
MIYTTITGIICGAIILWYLLTFNRLIQAKNAVDQSWSNIEVELKRRFDLIQNLVETTKGYAKHETETFRAVAELRLKEKLFTDASVANESQASLTPLIGKVMMLAESYPQLRADQNFLKLQDELTETENRIATRRNAYNQTVNRYQNLLDFIPSNMVGWIHEFVRRSFFDAPDELAQSAPKVTL